MTEPADAVARNCSERCVTGAVSDDDPLVYDEVMRHVLRNRWR